MHRVPAEVARERAVPFAELLALLVAPRFVEVRERIRPAPETPEPPAGSGAVVAANPQAAHGALSPRRDPAPFMLTPVRAWRWEAHCAQTTEPPASEQPASQRCATKPPSEHFNLTPASSEQTESASSRERQVSPSRTPLVRSQITRFAVVVEHPSPPRHGTGWQRKSRASHQSITVELAHAARSAVGQEAPATGVDV